MAITAKVMLQAKNEMIGATSLSFLPDYADGANKEWATNTPSLDFKMTVKHEIADQFKVGNKYTVTFEKN